MPLDLIDERNVLGYPDLNVALYQDGESYTITVRDSIQVVRWDTTSRREAKDRYFHPFCYGYERPVDQIVAPEEDGA